MMVSKKVEYVRVNVVLERKWEAMENEKTETKVLIEVKEKKKEHVSDRTKNTR